MDEERLVDIESKIAHQDQLLVDLNDAVSRQQLKLSDLEALLASLLDRVRNLAEAMPEATGGDERPPHY